VSFALALPILLPLATGLVVLVTGHRSDVAAKGLAVGGSALGLAVAVGVALAHLGSRPAADLVLGHGAGTPPIQFSLHVDQLSAVMLLLAHTVAFLVQVYSLGYLADDPRYPSYAALICLFTAAMSAVVTANSLWVLLVGWEVMGACSYFLIAHHWELGEARAGAVKAFLMTRTADLGLLFAIFVLGHRFGSYDITAVLAGVAHGAFARDALVLPALLLVLAVLGKSAQIPFHTWLPDAMPGPTPISALIHAATMVAAGVFLVARLLPLFLSSPTALTVLAFVAAATMFLSALYALFTHDLKRVLAWSTVSQLAYMFGALACGAYSAAVLHLLAHGAFKALLFLAAGSVVHAVGGATSMDAMGGLREKLPDTFATMTLGFGALAGVVPLVGFFTKDAVVAAAWEEARSGNLVWPWVAWLLVASMVATAALTVAYSLRAWLRVFFGDRPEGAPEVHDAPATMRVPLLVLAVPTTIGGLAVADPGLLLGPAYDEPLTHAAVSVFMTLVVVVSGVYVLRRWRDRKGWDVFEPVVLPHPPIDRVYDRGLVRPVWLLSRVVKAGDRDVVEGWADGTGASVRGLGWLLRKAQSGDVQTYLLVVVVGAAAVAVAAGALA
jgi:NADH-quinone oxidoreductase subunit L